MKHPNETPLEDWPESWLKLEVASLMNDPLYIIMTDLEKRAASYPVTIEEMQQYIRNRLK